MCYDTPPPKYRSDALAVAADLVRQVDGEHRALACEAARLLKRHPKLAEQAELAEMCKRFVQLGDDPGILMTCDADMFDNNYRVTLKCQSLEHAQQVHSLLIGIEMVTRTLS